MIQLLVRSQQLTVYPYYIDTALWNAYYTTQQPQQRQYHYSARPVLPVHAPSSHFFQSTPPQPTMFLQAHVQNHSYQNDGVSLISSIKAFPQKKHSTVFVPKERLQSYAFNNQKPSTRRTAIVGQMRNQSFKRPQISGFQYHRYSVASTTTLPPGSYQLTTRIYSTAPSSVLLPPSNGSDSKANNIFLQCCKEKHVDARCESRCNFDVLNKKVLTGMFLGSDPCPQSYGRDLMSCAAQDQDHTPCCQSQGVGKTTAGSRCLQFCQMSPGTNFQPDVSYLPCWGVLKEIKQCFKEALVTHS